MIVITVALLWLAILVLPLALCRSAARGDRMAGAPPRRAGADRP